MMIDTHTGAGRRVNEAVCEDARMRGGLVAGMTVGGRRLLLRSSTTRRTACLQPAETHSSTTTRTFVDPGPAGLPANQPNSPPHRSPMARLGCGSPSCSGGGGSCPENSRLGKGPPADRHRTQAPDTRSVARPCSLLCKLVLSPHHRGLDWRFHSMRRSRMSQRRRAAWCSRIWWALAAT
jgi:hypothetical protein